MLEPDRYEFTVVNRDDLIAISVSSESWSSNHWWRHFLMVSLKISTPRRMILSLNEYLESSISCRYYITAFLESFQSPTPLPFLMPISHWPTQEDIRSEVQGKSKTNGSHTDEWALKDVGVEWQHTRESTHTCTKGHPKPSERQVNTVCSWTMTFSCWERPGQPSRWPLGPHARRPWLADGAELLHHGVSWYVFRDAGRWAHWRRLSEVKRQKCNAGELKSS